MNNRPEGTFLKVIQVFHGNDNMGKGHYAILMTAYFGNLLSGFAHLFQGCSQAFRMFIVLDYQWDPQSK